MFVKSSRGARGLLWKSSRVARKMKVLERNDKGHVTITRDLHLPAVNHLPLDSL